MKKFQGKTHLRARLEISVTRLRRIFARIQGDCEEAYLWYVTLANNAEDEQKDQQDVTVISRRALSRYIEQNPVRVGLVQDVHEYDWSSGRSHILGEPNKILTGDSSRN